MEYLFENLLNTFLPNPKQLWTTPNLKFNKWSLNTIGSLPIRLQGFFLFLNSLYSCSQSPRQSSASGAKKEGEKKNTANYTPGRNEKNCRPSGENLQYTLMSDHISNNSFFLFSDPIIGLFLRNESRSIIWKARLWARERTISPHIVILCL